MNSDVYGYYIIKATEMQQTYGKELLTIFRFFCMELDWKIHVVKCKNFRDEHFSWNEICHSNLSKMPLHLQLCK